MTPAEFAATYGACARTVSDGTGIDSAVLLAQWANETAWGTAVAGNNLGNIRCSPTSFCQYASIDDFAAGCIATFHNGFYNAVLAATTPAAQLAAIVASPWSAAHYGGTLQPFYDPVEVYEMTPGEDATLNRSDSILSGSRLRSKAVDQALIDIEKEVKAIASPPPATVDLTPVLNAIAAVKADVDALAAKVASLTLKAQ
jgi:hypothetical protein